MSTLQIVNNLCPTAQRGCQFKVDGANWTNYPCGVSTPTNLGYDAMGYFRIQGARIPGSSIAVTLMNASHTVQFIDTVNGYVLLRFVPKPVFSEVPPDIIVEFLNQPIVAPTVNENTGPNVSIQFQKLATDRFSDMKRLRNNQTVFVGRYSCAVLNEPIPIGKLLKKETLELNLEAPKPNTVTKFAIGFKKSGVTNPLKVIFYDYNNVPGHDPHIEAVVLKDTSSPSDVNITIEGDET